MKTYDQEILSAEEVEQIADIYKTNMTRGISTTITDLDKEMFDDLCDFIYAHEKQYVETKIDDRKTFEDLFFEFFADIFNDEREIAKEMAELGISNDD